MNGDDVERVLHQRAKSRLALLQGVGFAAIAGRTLEWPQPHDYLRRASWCRRTLVLQNFTLTPCKPGSRDCPDYRNFMVSCVLFWVVYTAFKEKFPARRTDS